jgi:hypothetical protein
LDGVFAGLVFLAGAALEPLFLTAGVLFLAAEAPLFEAEVLFLAGALFLAGVLFLADVLLADVLFFEAAAPFLEAAGFLLEAAVLFDPARFRALAPARDFEVVFFGDLAMTNSFSPTQLRALSAQDKL